MYLTNIFTFMHGYTVYYILLFAFIFSGFVFCKILVDNGNKKQTLGKLRLINDVIL